jgi:hypothetical protein
MLYTFSSRTKNFTVNNWVAASEVFGESKMADVHQKGSTTLVQNTYQSSPLEV